MPASLRTPLFVPHRASQIGHQAPVFPLFEDKDSASHKENPGHLSHNILKDALFSGLQTDPHQQRSVESLCRTGQLDTAVEVISRLEELGIGPAEYAYVSVLGECGKIKAVSQAKLLHRLLARHESQVTGHLGDHLVVTLAKCGILDDAYDVFFSLELRTVYSWTAMISAFAESGRGQEALKLYSYMEEDGVKPDSYTFVSLLQACAIIPDLHTTNGFHSEAVMKGYTLDNFFNNTLLYTYGRCESILEAENVFLRMEQRSSVSWNAMLSAYLMQGLLNKMFLIYRQMQAERVVTNQRTLVLILEACGAFVENAEVRGEEGELVSVMIMEIGRALHADAVRKGLDNVFVRSTLVNMYGKCGCIVNAEMSFDDSEEHNAIIWNVMLTACIEQGEGGKVLQLYRQMCMEGCSPSPETLVISLQACWVILEDEEELPNETMLLNIGKALHADAESMGFTSDTFVGSAIVSMYGALGGILEAERVFDGLVGRNVVSWNAMLSGYVEHGEFGKALLLYRQMIADGVMATLQTFLLTLQTCTFFFEKERDKTLDFTDNMLLDIGNSLHADARKQGFASECYVANTIMNMYGKYGCIEEAENVFGGLLKRDIVTWQVLFSAYLEQEGNGDKALQLYNQMHDEGFGCDEFATTSALQACIETGNLEVCMETHFKIVCVGYDLSTPTSNTLIRAYGSCSSMQDAQDIFDGMHQHDRVSWNACMAGYAQEGNIGASLRLLVEMELVGMVPDRITFVSFLTACCHTSVVENGINFFESMIRDNGSLLNERHYVAMIDIFGRIGDFDKLESILLSLPVQVYLAVWLCWLGACRTHSNTELGRQAFDTAVNVGHQDTSLYVLMSNIYAAEVGTKEGKSFFKFD